ncbi:Ribosomal large subunit pseudouridine synthase C [compost metagenome]|jgi:23S rRNA pseudouridine955/2504/2580 synthase|uniref:Pseudouridine synthase n=1 Tax=Cupriavidus necator (strain ATCC 43291 / DSM 13513 / CCUG 52238 / LMG 8453 / N-1) TaxID=1042878 RepID=G0ER99_CUPNN|nr:MULTISPECIES: RluA family pseudouridine synthase [Cupriavidus]AEI77781.1 ribosomal large subunit pseudouridine synthase C [Cupriavidus necator N-1]KAI3606500.1 LSU rRNA pseudouridine(955/2504/2580) synthase [Cupriavidus necator H850]MDX6013684.1 RluA family pseudouridine synthase [Cupriavidus necator]QUN27270.1 RluA family pseudouridine synthase [Cupriavidus sp. KK10]
MNELRHQIEKAAEAAPASPQVAYVTIDEGSEGQRIDNFLLKVAKGVPKSHIYRVLRSGEVRVNKGRIDATYRLQSGDVVRIPPMRVANSAQSDNAQHVPAGEFPVLFEDAQLLVINKPAGVAVHGGSGVAFGVIEQLRRSRPQAKFLELVHRLDRETSGILVLAKKRSALVHLHEQIRGSAMDKRYFACVAGEFPNARQHVKLPLYKYSTPDGERRVRVQADGLASHTVFNRVEAFQGFTLLEAELKTGRTHQIRVHLAHSGFPIVGDEKYGDFSLNKALARSGAKPGLKRMFLHAHRLVFIHPATGEPLAVEAPLPDECVGFLQQLRELHAPE